MPEITTGNGEDMREGPEEASTEGDNIQLRLSTVTGDHAADTRSRAQTIYNNSGNRTSERNDCDGNVNRRQTGFTQP